MSDSELESAHTKFRKQDYEKFKKSMDDMPPRDDPRWNENKK